MPDSSTPTTGRLVRELPANGVTTASFSPNGLAVVTGLADGTTDLWRVRDGGLIHTLRGRGAPDHGRGVLPGAADCLRHRMPTA